MQPHKRQLMGHRTRTGGVVAVPAPTSFLAPQELPRCFFTSFRILFFAYSVRCRSFWSRNRGHYYWVLQEVFEVYIGASSYSYAFNVIPSPVLLGGYYNWKLWFVWKMRLKSGVFCGCRQWGRSCQNWMESSQEWPSVFQLLMCLLWISPSSSRNLPHTML